MMESCSRESLGGPRCLPACLETCVNNPQVSKPLVGRADSDLAQAFSRASRSHEGQKMLWGTRSPTPALPVASPEELGWDLCAAWGKKKKKGERR